jgi:tripartite ATP-independent transporter DctP family solute receptor
VKQPIVFQILLASAALAAVGCQLPTRVGLPTNEPSVAVAASAATYPALSFRIGHVSAHSSLIERDAQAYLIRVDQMTGGKASGQSFADSQLGKQQALVELVQIGSLEMVVSSSELVSAVPEFGVFDLPFAFADRAEVKQAVEGPLGQELARRASLKNLVVLGYWENGFRQITNNLRPIRTPHDLEGLKIRTPQNLDRVRMFQSWGAKAAPLDFSELFSALQAGVFDGEENPLAQIASAKLFEVQKYLSFTGHVYTPTYLIASKVWWDGLPLETQHVLREAAVATGDGSRMRGEEFDRLGETIIKEAGVEVNRDVDRAAFRRASVGLYDEFRKKFGPTLLEPLKTAPRES